MEESKEMTDSAKTDISIVPLTKTPSNQYREDESEEDRFNKALQELKNLRSQLHHAADYCENEFSKAEQKNIVVEGTKSYIREAIITVVDHLGTVSSKLEQELLSNTMVVQTEQRIDCLKQRLLACQQYTANLELSNKQLNVIFPRHYGHYISREAATSSFGTVGQHEGISSDIPRAKGTNSREFDTSIMKNELSVMAPSPLYPVGSRAIPASNQTIPGVKLAKATPVIEGSSILSKTTNTLLNCKFELHTQGGVHQRKKHTQQANNFLSFLRVSKRKT